MSIFLSSLLKKHMITIHHIIFLPMEKLFIPVILGTSRKDNMSEKAAAYIVEVLKFRNDIEVQLIRPEEYTHGYTIPSWEETELTTPWKDIVKKAKAFIIVTPEYNHGYPGELKLLLDQELAGYLGKPVGLCGVSAGGFGGTRVVEQLTQVVRELGMIVLSYSLYFPKVKEIFGMPKEELEKSYKDRILKMADILVSYSEGDFSVQK